MDNNPQSSFFQDPTRNIAERVQETIPPQTYQVPPAPPQPFRSPLNNPQMTQKSNDVTQLVNLGKIRETVELFGFHFTMRTLTAHESADAIRSFALLSETSQAMNMAIATLARAIEMINGTPLESLYEYYIPKEHQDKNLDAVSKKMEIVGYLDSNVVSQLIGEYQKLVEKSVQALGTPSVIKK